MAIIVPGGWLIFCIAASIVMLCSLIMFYLQNFFVTEDPDLRDFTILDLEWASNEKEINNTLRGLMLLPPEIGSKVRRALLTHLYIDFLFMPAAYGAMFIACMQLCLRMPVFGLFFFAILGWSLAIAWVSHIFANISLFRKFWFWKKNYQTEKPEKTVFRFIPFRIFRLLEILKWSISLTVLSCVLSAVLYLWVSGFYAVGSLFYLLITVAEFILFIVVLIISLRWGKKWRASLRA